MSSIKEYVLNKIIFNLSIKDTYKANNLEF